MSITDIEYDGIRYKIAKLFYLLNNHNIDQEILLWIVKGKGVYIQQERKERKLYLLNKISNYKGLVENTVDFVNRIMLDTILFPLPPPLPITE